MAQHFVMKTFKERKERGEFTGKYGRKNNKPDNEEKVLELFDYTSSVTKNERRKLL